MILYAVFVAVFRNPRKSSDNYSSPFVLLAWHAETGPNTPGPIPRGSSPDREASRVFD